MNFDRFEGVRGRPAKGFDVKKFFFGSFPEFEDKSSVRGTDVFPVYEEGKTIKRRLVTVLESPEVKKRRDEVKAELGLTGTGRNLQPIKKEVIGISFEDAVGDIRYYQEQLGTEKTSWENL